MADLEDVLDQYEEDDNTRPQATAADLFGDDDEEQGQEDDDYQPVQYEEEVEEAQQDETRPQSGQAAGPSQVDTVDDRRAALLKLAQKKRKEAEGDEPKKKKKKRDSDEKRDKGSKLSKSGRPQRDGKLKQQQAKPRARTSVADEPDLPSDALDDAEDVNDFIDDEGLVPEEEEAIGSDVADDEEDGEAGPPPEEAVEVARGEEEEADDDADPFGHKKRKKRKESDQQMAMVVDDKIAKMEAAAEADMEQHEQARPAIQKLKFLAEVEEFLAQKKYHELFVSAGGLGVLKAWLEPYSDGSLPNARIRSAVLRACKLLPIDTSREDMKSQLKKSQLGNRIMFLLKCQDETTANRQLARELVQQWSRPIFFDPAVEAEKRRIRMEQLKLARTAALEVQKEAEAEKLASQGGVKPKQAKYGEAGYRWHASIPQASKLDYVVEPTREDRIVQAAAAAGHVAEKDSRFSKKMRDVLRKQKSTTARAAKPSVEGRSITLMQT